MDAQGSGVLQEHCSGINHFGNRKGDNKPGSPFPGFQLEWEVMSGLGHTVAEGCTLCYQTGHNAGMTSTVMSTEHTEVKLTEAPIG